jgi:hypothetical protein
MINILEKLTICKHSAGSLVSEIPFFIYNYYSFPL